MGDNKDDLPIDGKEVKEIDPSKLGDSKPTESINLDDIEIPGWAKSRGKKKQ